MLGHRLPGHVQIDAKFPERLPVIRPQPVEQPPAARVRERLEHLVLGHVHGGIMQPFGCMSSAFRGLRHFFAQRGLTRPPAVRILIPTGRYATMRTAQTDSLTRDKLLHAARELMLAKGYT